MNDLQLAAFNGHEILLRMILDSELVDLNSENDSFERTALMWTSSEGHDKIVMILLDHGADVNVIRINGTALGIKKWT